VTAHLSHRIDDRAIQALLTSPQGGVIKDLLRRGLKVESKAKLNLQSDPRRVNTGRLRGSIRTTLVSVAGKPAVRVGTTVFYALYVHDGTGLYGPKHSLIYPRKKKVLRWKASYGKKGGYAYARYTRGMRPNPFLKNALSAAKG